MYQFQNNEESWVRLDYKIIQGGNSIKLYCDTKILEGDIAWLTSENYLIKEFDCQNWNDKEILHNNLHAKFDFPNYYGGNFDALQESLNEIDIEESGLVVVFRNFDRINTKTAHTLLDVFATSSRYHLTFGKRLLILLEVNKSFKTESVGAVEVRWF